MMPPKKEKSSTVYRCPECGAVGDLAFVCSGVSTNRRHPEAMAQEGTFSDKAQRDDRGNVTNADPADPDKTVDVFTPSKGQDDLQVADPEQQSQESDPERDPGAPQPPVTPGPGEPKAPVQQAQGV